MNVHSGSKTSVGQLIGAAVVTLLLFADSGCQRLDDIADEILRARDAGSRDAGSQSDGGGQAPSCSTDADCRVFPDYCTGCDCRALGVMRPDPICAGPGVQCLVDPCREKSASCQAGQCVLALRAKVERCGSATCPTGQFCCNASCGVCTPPGGACTQQLCL